MKYLVKMTQKEYRSFRMYTCKARGFDWESRREFVSDFKGQEAEDWLTSTGKVILKERIDRNGRKYNDAYLVIKGSEQYLMDVLYILAYTNVYDEDIARWNRQGGKPCYTILHKVNVDTIIREV